MLSRAEMQELMDSGMSDDTYFEKQEALRWRKEGWKVWSIEPTTATPVIEQRGFETQQDALAFIRRNRKRGRWFAKPADQSDPDYYHDGEAGYYSGPCFDS